VRDIAVEYAQVRVQFGSPLSRFQAIQRMLSEIAAEVEASRAILEQALDQYDAGQTATLPILSAKPRAAQAATVVAAHAHQILGAIGYTEEHHLHRSTKRLWAWRDAWTSQRQDEDAVGALIVAGGGDGLWPLLSGTP
jgi:acyl-CoA dehydrogenase